MSVRRILACFALFALVGLVSAADEKSPSKAAQAFDKIKKMAGEWVALDDKGQPTEKVISKFRVTAGGSAVQEVIFPGTDHEMVTMYHLDNDELVLTHYCVLGNQPRMKADLSGPADTIAAFKFCGCGNLKSDKAAHMNQGTIKFVSADRIDSKWDKCENGKVDYTAAFKLARKK